MLTLRGWNQRYRVTPPLRGCSKPRHAHTVESPAITSPALQPNLNQPQRRSPRPNPAQQPVEPAPQPPVQDEPIISPPIAEQILEDEDNIVIIPISHLEANSTLELPQAMTPEKLSECAKITMAPPVSRQPLAFPSLQHSRLAPAGRTEGTYPIGAALTY